MTIEQSLQLIKEKGLQVALETLASEQPDARLLLKQMENLRAMLQQGKVSGEEALIRFNPAILAIRKKQR